MSTTVSAETAPAAPSVRPPGRSRRRQKVMRIGLMLVIFAGGAVVGSGVTATWLHDRASHVFRFDPNAARQRMIDRLDRQFQLSEEQKLEAGTVIDGHFERFRSFRDQMRPLISNEMDRFQSEIGGILNEEQRESWKEDSESFRRLLWSRGSRKHRHGDRDGKHGHDRDGSRDHRHRDQDHSSEHRHNERQRDSDSREADGQSDSHSVD